MKTYHNSASRRHFIKVSLAGVAALQMTGASPSLAAAELPHLDEADATAKALSYAHDAAAVSTELRADKTHVCASCRFYTNAADAWGPCSLFPGKAVAATGWCKGWVARA